MAKWYDLPTEVKELILENYFEGAVVCFVGRRRNEDEAGALPILLVSKNFVGPELLATAMFRKATVKLLSTPHLARPRNSLHPNHRDQVRRLLVEMPHKVKVGETWITSCPVPARLAKLHMWGLIEFNIRLIWSDPEEIPIFEIHKPLSSADEGSSADLSSHMKCTYKGKEYQLKSVLQDVIGRASESNSGRSDETLRLFELERDCYKSRCTVQLLFQIRLKYESGRTESCEATFDVEDQCIRFDAGSHQVSIRQSFSFENTITRELFLTLN